MTTELPTTADARSLDARSGPIAGPSSGEGAGSLRARLTGRAGTMPVRTIALGCAEILLLATAYFAWSWIGLSFALIDRVSPISPPMGIAVAVIVVGGRWLWPGVLLGAAASVLVEGGSMPTALLVGVAASAEVLLASVILDRRRFRPQLDRLVDVPRLTAGAVLPPALGAAIGVLGLALSSRLTPTEAPLAWVTWWAGDAIAILVVGGFLLTWLVPSASDRLRRHPIEALLALGVVVLVSVVLFFDTLGLRAIGQSVAFPLIPAVIWVAFRVGPRGTTLAALLYSTIAIVATEQGLGPFVGTTREGSLAYLVGFMGLVAVTGAAVAAVVAEREAGLAALEAANLRASEALRQLQAMEAIGRRLAEGGSTSESLGTVVAALHDVFGYTHPSIYTADGTTLRLRAQRGYADPVLAIDSARGVMGRVTRDHATAYLPDVVVDPDFIRADDAIRSEIAVPLLNHGAFLGVLNVEHTSRLDERDLATVSLVGDRVAAALALALERDALAELAVRDPLTGLHNRRYFDGSLGRIAAAQARLAPEARPSVGVILFDLDHFGAFNKRHGHQAGDAVLRAFGAILRQRIRGSDLVARYGGEEFVAILSAASAEDAARVADEVRITLEATDITAEDGQRLPVTVSAGCSGGDGVDVALTDLLAAADVGLQMAKRAGRNQVVTA